MYVCVDVFNSFILYEIYTKSFGELHATTLFLNQSKVRTAEEAGDRRNKAPALSK